MERRFQHEKWLRKIRIREEFQRPIDPELKKQLADRRRRWDEERVRVTPPCSECGLPGKFIRPEGAYTRVWGIYQCPDGHLFIRG